MASSAKVPAVPSSEEATACTACRQHRHKKAEPTAPTLSPAAFDGSCSKEHLHPKNPEKPQAKAPAVRPSTGATACTKGSGTKHRTIKIPKPRPCHQQHSMAPAARNTCTQRTRRSHRPRPQPCDPAQERQPAPREVARSIAQSRYPSADLASSSNRWLLQQGTLAPKEPGEATGQGPSRATQHRSDSLHQGKWHEASRNQDTQAPTLPAAAFDGSCRKAAARRPSKHTWHAVPRSPPQTSTWDQSRPDQCDGGGHDNSSFGGGGVRIRYGM